ncbi:DDB1- and CUL4-associated factor 13 [Armadillidium vulgare]|nr:DDB1- and CUL4-associated factor 13 [Armadillidium vulgare]
MSIKNIKVLSRNPDHYMRETKQDIYKMQRNFDPDLHPLHAAREYKQALNAVKLERVFAKPFIGSLSHSESVSSMCRHSHSLSCIYSGTVEGELYLWDLQSKKCKWKVQAHDGEVHCITSAPDGKSFFSVGNDKTIKQWLVPGAFQEFSDTPIICVLSDCKTLITGISHHRERNEFITCGERILLWDASAKAPKSSFDWGTTSRRHEATAVNICFNAVEKNLFATSDHANNIILYDTRMKEVKKLRMKLRINALEWNPMEAMMLTVASEDYNCYTFDIRNMNMNNRILSIHGGHTAAVISLSYSPTGKEFCSGSYDKSIRIFNVEEKHSRDVYHAKRMFRIKSVLWSGDGKYITSGSSDHNIRIWKAKASEKLGIELKKKYGAFPEVKRIARHRHLPKSIYHAKKEHTTIKESIQRKQSNRRRHSKPGSVPFPKASEEPIVGLQDDYTTEPSGH